MRNAKIRILHKVKDEKTGAIVHKEVYNGPCKICEVFSVREQLGGVENNSRISVLISPVRDFDIDCGDRCIIDNKGNRTVKSVTKCLENVSEGFKHISLSLR